MFISGFLKPSVMSATGNKHANSSETNTDDKSGLKNP